MGEGFFSESFSETKSGMRATHFEPVLSHGTYLERFYCEQEARKMQGGHDESLFGRDLTCGGRWSAIDMGCEALFVNFFEELLSFCFKCAEEACSSPESRERFRILL